MDRYKQELLENLDRYRLGLDDEFHFKCRGCGKCCKNREDIILTTRDLHSIARKLGISMADTIKTYCEMYIGKTSRLPVVRLVPVGITRSCPLLREKRCMVHDVKPVVCALFPLGRCFTNQSTEMDSVVTSKPVYILQPVECGGVRKQHTVRSWLEKFGIPVEDEFFQKWNHAITSISSIVHEMEETGASEKAINLIWNAASVYLYLRYDTDKELMPQFDANLAILKEGIRGLRLRYHEASQ